MNKKNINNIILISLLFIYVLFYRLVLFNKYLSYSESISASVILFITFIAIVRLGFKKNKTTILKRNVTNLSITIIILFFAISYGIGCVVGFLKNSYSLTFSAILNNILSPIIIIVCTELFRYTVINSNKNKKSLIVIYTILITLFELAISVRTINFLDITGLFKITTATILPIISKNIVLSYLNYHVGYVPGLVYRLIMDLYVYIMPIVPDLGDYINSMVGIVLPFIIYIYSSRMIAEYNKEEKEFTQDKFRLTDIPALLFIIILVILISGYFPYSIMGIGSGSMTPVIRKGDAVIIHKVEKESELKVGDVIAFYNKGKTIVHRLVEIVDENGTKFYCTKGDANQSRDNIKLQFKDIKGVVKLKIPFIAYPSIYWTEFIEKESKS